VTKHRRDRRRRDEDVETLVDHGIEPFIAVGGQSHYEALALGEGVLLNLNSYHTNRSRPIHTIAWVRNFTVTPAIRSNTAR